jgi:Domain of unknown function DUF11
MNAARPRPLVLPLLACLALLLGITVASDARAAGGDLVVSVRGFDHPVAQGGVAQYKVVVTNHGTGTLGPVDVTINLIGLTGLSAQSSSANVACRPAAGFECQIPTMSPAESVYVTVVARVNVNAIGSARATVTAAGGGATASGEAQTAIDASIRPADVSLKLASSSGGRRGAVWAWRITNRGPGAALRTVFDEWGALGTNSITRAHASSGSCSVSGPAGGGAAIHCTLGTIPANRSITVTIYAPTYKETGISIVEHPSVASSVPDPHPRNNNGGAAVKVPLRPAI